MIGVFIAYDNETTYAVSVKEKCYGLGSPKTQINIKSNVD